MREIKFRYYVFCDGIINKTEWTLDDIGDEGHPFIQDDNQTFKIVQFTGIKDKNEKEIYEGDVMKGNYHNLCVDINEGVGVVKMGKGEDSDGYSHGVWYGWKCGNNSLLDINSSCEVIGNIYENSELISSNVQKKNKVCGNSNMRNLTEEDRINGRSHRCSESDPCYNCVHIAKGESVE